MKKTLVILALIIAIAAGGYALAHRSRAPKAEPSLAERMLAKAEKRDIDVSIEVSGDVQPAFSLDVKPEVGGKIRKLHVLPGQVVKEGDLLVEIDDTDLLKSKQSSQTEIEGAKLLMDKARKNYERGKELFEGKLISLEVFDNLSAEYAIAENGLVKAQRAMEQIDEQLKKARLSSPTSGTVLSVPVTEGQVLIAAASVNSGTTVMTIANLSQLLVQTHVNQVDVARLELGKTVKLRAESLHDLEMDARITFIAPVATVTNNVKGFDVRATIDRPNKRLLCGMTVNMTVPIAKAQDAISVPIAAIFKGQGKSKVVYVRSGESTEKREVKVGVTNFDFVEILKGLDEGEQILLVEPSNDAEKKS